MPKDNLDLEAVVESVKEVNVGFEALKETLAEKTAEMLLKGDVDILLEEKLTRINESISEHQESIDKLYAATKRKHIQVDGKDVDLEELEQKAHQWADDCARRRGTRAPEFSHEDMMAYKSAFRNYLKHDDRVLTADGQKALSAGSDPDGGYTV